MNAKTAAWLKGLAAAVVGGAAQAVCNIVVAPETFNLSEGLGKLLQSAAVSGLLMGALYLRRSPWPGIEARPVKLTRPDPDDRLP